MAFAHTIAMARNLLADGRAEDVLRMVEPLIDKPVEEASTADRAFLTALLARVHAVHTGDVQRALDLLAPFEEASARAALPDTPRAQVTLWLAWAHARRDQTFDEEARALTLFDEAQHLFDAELDANGRCWANLGRAHAYFRIDEYQLMRAALDEVAPVRTSLRDTAAARWFHDLSVAASRFQGRYDEAQRHLRALAGEAPTPPSREVRGRSKAYQAALYLDLGHAPGQIIDTAKQAIALLRDVTAEVEYPLLTAYHAHIRALLLRGDWSATQRVIDAALRDVGARPTTQAHLNTLQARLALRRNQPEAASEVMEQLFAQAHRLPHGLQRSHVALLRGELLAHAGQFDEAYSWLRRAHQNARETGHRGHQLRALLVEAHVALDASHLDRADALLDALDQYEDYFSVLPFAASRFYLLGRRHEAAGRTDEAQATYQQACSAYALIGDAYHAARVQRSLASVEPTPQAHAALSRALETFKHLGLDDEAEATREQRTNLPADSEASTRDPLSTLGTTLARASRSPRLVAEAWIQALEEVLPDTWLGVYRHAKHEEWSCVHEHGAPPPALSYPPAPGRPCETGSVRWIPLHASSNQHFCMGIDVSDISASTWRDARARWSTWRPVLQLALDQAMLHSGEVHAPSSMGAAFSFGDFVHESASMRSLAQRIHRMRASHSPVLITGERGAGKTTVARTIHETSERREGSWHTIDCGGVSPEPIDARLFGHPAEHAPGLLRRADGGTLLVQGIDALPLDTQAKLLRVLNAGELFAPGIDAPTPVDVRILASSAEDLNALVRAGRFRRDLYHRLHVISMHVPPLRERPADIPALARHFATTLAPAGTPPVSITTRALDALRHYHWPGNVRQLRNTIDRAVGLVASEPAPTIDQPMLPDVLQAQASTIPAQDGWAEILRPDCSLDDVLARTEKEIIERVLTECEGQITASADMLGLTRQGLYKKMKRLSIDPASFKQSMPSSALAS